MTNSPAYKEKNNSLWVAISAAVVVFLAYTSIFCYRKAFNVAAFQGYSLWGLDYKVVLVVTQVGGYMLSKFYGIRFISELKRIGRGKLVLLLVLVSWIAWLVFALIPPPYNFWVLFFNGFPLGLLWGVIFSYIEGRRATDFISAFLAVSFIFGSGVAKSVAQFVMTNWGVTEYWMPFTVGAIFIFPLALFMFLLEKIPPPDQSDIESRNIRLPMVAAERRQLLRNFLPGIFLLVVIYIMVTILREVRDSFMADMWRESGQILSPGIFAKTETIISITILLMIAVMVVIRKNYLAFTVAQFIMLSGFIIAGLATLLYTNQQIGLFAWMTGIGLGLYMVYIPYNSILFERFIATFRFAGNVGFLIYLADSFGYLGSVAVLLAKSVFKLQISWLNFYIQLVTYFSIAGIIGCAGSLIYFHFKKKSTVNPGLLANKHPEVKDITV